MLEQGTVTKIEENIAFIALEKRASCGYCHACDMSKGSNSLKVLNDKNAKVGDKVMINVPEWNMVKIGFFVYIVPLILFVTAYLIGDSAGRNYSADADKLILWGILAAAFVLGLYYLAMKFYDQAYRTSVKNKPSVTAIIAK